MSSPFAKCFLLLNFHFVFPFICCWYNQCGSYRKIIVAFCCNQIFCNKFSVMVTNNGLFGAFQLQVTPS